MPNLVSTSRTLFRQDLTGQVFTRWTVIRFLERRPRSTVGTTEYWECRCECGVIKAVSKSNLVTGQSRSCGCLTRESTIRRSTKHGGSVIGNRHPLYEVWSGMKKRCHNKNCHAFHNYGGRGIILCAEWHDFATFLKDMEPGYKQGLSIDRIDNDGNYCKENCKWSTTSEQARNTRHNNYLEHGGERMMITEWSLKLGGSCSMIRSRLSSGWSLERALTTPAMR